MKTAGIVVDNYKIDRFKKELIKNGFTDFEVVPFINDTSNIKIQVEENQYNEIKNICTKVEMYFKRSN